MDYLEILNQIFTLCIVPLLGILTKYAVNFITQKMKETSNKIENEKVVKYIDLLTTTINDCIIATNQTYVEALKGQNAFDADAQKTALEMTKNAVLTVLTEDAKEYLTQIYGDLDELITIKIESTIGASK